MEYKKHQSSILNLSARTIASLVIILAILIDFFSFTIQVGWVVPVVIFYFEKRSLFVKYHSLCLLLFEIVKGGVMILLIVISILFDLPYLVLNNNQHILGIMAYLDMGVVALFLGIIVRQLILIYSYKQFRNKRFNRCIYSYLKKDPDYVRMEKYSRI